MPDNKRNIETIAIHAGMHEKGNSQTIVAPLEPGTIFEHSEQGYQEGDYIYSRYSNPNREQLEAVLSELEGGQACAAFSSGVAAMATIYQSLDKGDHIIIPKDVYHGSRKQLKLYGSNWGLEYDEVNMTDLGAVEQAVKANTKLILIESPSNPLLLITDIRAVSEIAHKNGAMVCVDNTWPTPVNLNPFDFGADLALHSTTKYLGGHSDILGGAVISKKADAFFDKIRATQRTLGAVPSPRDCWLLNRSISSLPYRVRGHNENAVKVAQFLDNHSSIEAVYYPGLFHHPGHDIAKEQMRGFGGMISFLVNGDINDTLKVVASSKLITRATSLGGVESLWEHRRSSEDETSVTPQNLIRLSVGLEHVDDIIADIDQALND